MSLCPNAQLKWFLTPRRFKDHPTLNDRYLLLHLLGRGGFSEVYKVRSTLFFSVKAEEPPPPFLPFPSVLMEEYNQFAFNLLFLLRV